ncbi:MAG TPA: sulfatase-like hydrolase/transferase [Hyphomicrobiaceae bacterium]|nr:sulfatase-like hydrolase/transferase [Hyphomicrobiaceae bacterium]
MLRFRVTSGKIPSLEIFRRLSSHIREVIGRHHLAATIIPVLLVSGLIAFFWRTEGEIENIAFTAGTTAALIAVLTLMTRRLFFSTLIVSSMVAIVAWASMTKRQTMDMVVHAYDLFFYLSSWSTISYLWADHRHLVISFVAGIVMMFVAGWIAWRFDTTRIPIKASAIGFLLAVAVSTAGAATKGERRHMQFHFQNLYVSSFYASWAETLGTLWHGTMLEAKEQNVSTKPFVVSDVCTPKGRRPHIVLIHQESIVPPGMFPALSYDRSVDTMFKSDDGKTHGLRVETFGGASWLSEFSLLTGISTQAFGGMRQFVQTFTVNRLKDTLPQSLAACGYRNVVFYPMLRNFVSNDKFYKSIGLTEVFDLRDQKAKSAQERDRFYFANALAEMERHVASSDQPLFTYIQTMSGHWPYDVPFAPDENVPGGGPGTHPEMHEYLRRISLANRDFNWLMDEIKRRLPNEPVLIVHYGDHQPTATRTLLGFRQELEEPEDITLTPDSPGFLVYYAMRGHNWRVPALPDHKNVDIPYLGALILRGAGLPLSDANRYRLEMMDACGGRYWGCSNKDRVLAFHRRLIDSGIIIAR